MYLIRLEGFESAAGKILNNFYKNFLLICDTTEENSLLMFHTMAVYIKKKRSTLLALKNDVNASVLNLHFI